VEAQEDAMEKAAEFVHRLTMRQENRPHTNKLYQKKKELKRTPSSMMHKYLATSSHAGEPNQDFYFIKKTRRKKKTSNTESLG
jgi:nicotinic acid mononucleotide adenylyltransferase